MIYRENLLSKELIKLTKDYKILSCFDSLDFQNNQIIKSTPKNFAINGKNKSLFLIDYKYKLFGYKIYSKIRSFRGLSTFLVTFKPDLIYINSLQFLDLFTIIKFKKRYPNTKLIGELNATKENSAQRFISSVFLHKVFYRWVISMNFQHIDYCYYGSVAARDFSSKYYKTPFGLEIINLGVDENAILKALEYNKSKLKIKFGFKPNDFLMISGGKIDEKKKIIELVQAFLELDFNPSNKLLLFGSIADRLSDAFNKLISLDQRINFVGWLSDVEMYEYLRIADFAVFPGSKSAIWESAIAMGLPLIAQSWDGMDYINFGSNILYLYKNGDTNEIKNALVNLIEEDTKRTSMSRNASANWKNVLSYKLMAAKIINKYNELKEEQI
jgi:glycosyltransferase involved in cell wall biosynthesis